MCKMLDDDKPDLASLASIGTGSTGLLITEVISEFPYPEDTYALAKLREYGLSITLKMNTGSNIFMRALNAGKTKTLEWVLKSGDYRNIINKSDNKGYNPLSLAVNTSNTEAIKLLIKHGADVNHQNKDGNTALHFAVRDLNLDAVTVLLNNGANYSITNKRKDTALKLAERLTKDAQDKHKQQTAKKIFSLIETKSRNNPRRK